MGQNSSSEPKSKPETNATAAKTRERKSGSLFCSNWTNVGICSNNCSTINVHEPVSPNREIEEKLNESSVHDGNSEVIDSGRNLISFDDDSSRDSNSTVAYLETTSITADCDTSITTESLRHDHKFFRQSSPYKDRSEVYLLKNEIMESEEDSIIESSNENVVMVPNNQLEIDNAGGNNACPFTSNTDAQDVTQTFKKNSIPNQIELSGLLRHTKSNI